MIISSRNLDVQLCEISSESPNHSSLATEIWDFSFDARASGLNIVTVQGNAPASTSTADPQEFVQVFFVDHLSDDQRRFTFRFPVLLKKTVNDGVYVIENGDLGLFVFEEFESRAQAALAKQFSRLWDDIAQEDAAPLAPSAKKLGDALRFTVAKVEEVGG